MKEEEFLSTWLYKLKYRDIFWAWGKRQQLGGLFQQGDSKELKTAKIKGSCKKKTTFRATCNAKYHTRNLTNKILVGIQDSLKKWAKIAVKFAPI